MAAAGAAGAGAEAGPQLSELESLQLRANKTTDESLESTRRMITLCEESQGAGIKTIEMLEQQGEQLNRVEQGLDGMGAELKVAEKHLHGMEKWCGICVCPWNRMPKIKDAEWSNHSSDNTSKPGSLEGTGNRSGYSSVPDAPQGGYIQRINNDAREDEMEENMQAVGSMLGNMKNMAQDMGDEISKQNKQTDRILDKTENRSKDVENADVRAQKLLK